MLSFMPRRKDLSGTNMSNISISYLPWQPFDDELKVDSRSEFVRRLHGISEHYAAGFFEEANASMYRRYAMALVRSAENNPIMPWKQSLLFPTTEIQLTELGKEDHTEYALWEWYNADARKMPAFVYFYSDPFWFRFWLYEQKLKSLDSTEDRQAFETLKRYYDEQIPRYGGFTHGTVHYGRVLREGLNDYRRRIQSQLEKIPTPESQELYKSLLMVIDAAKIIHRRLLERLESTPAEGEMLNRRIRLIEALNRVPFEPARSFYEAMVGLNFLFYFEGPDSPGRMDQYLWDFYQHDRSAGLITDAEVLDLLNEFFRNMDNVCGWNVAIGGTKGPNGECAVNELTYLIMEASKGRRRPNLALRIPDHADDRLWDSAFDVIATGNGLPALYNDSEYVNALRTYGLGLNENDLYDISYGGCTETMIQGCSNVGSLASTFHMLKVLEDTIDRSLAKSSTFEEFLAKYFEALETEAEANCNWISKSNEIRAKFYPQLIRTLLVDDCIDNGREFRAGGARYNWDIVGLEGFSNVVDSLIVLKHLVFEEGFITGEKFQQVLGANFKGHEELLARINRLPKYGQGNAEVDAFAAKIATFTFDQFKKRCGWGGRKYLASCLMFVTYAERGKCVGATPDGRLAGAPLGDSFGAYQGRDTRGPTALINSVTGFPHKDAPGTLVVNVRLTKDMVTEPATRKKIRSLVETYFSRGGMQIQINVVDQKILEDAIKHPDKHGNLIIRIGGYSEYFNNLSEKLKLSVLERTIHGV